MDNSNSISRAFNLLAVTALIAKIGAALAQLVLGWFLVPEQYALFAAATSAQIVVAGLRDAGIGRYLVQKGVYDGLAYKAAVFVLLTSSLALLLLFALAPFFQKLYAQPDLIKVLAPLAMCIPVQALGTIYRSKLRIDMQFGRIAKLDVSSAIVQYSFTIAGAWVGMGVYSLVLGTVMATIVQFIVGRAYSGGLGTSEEGFTIGDFKMLWYGCRWIILSSFLFAIAMRGDYFVIGIIEDKALVGYYFFGFQLAFAVGVLFTNSLQLVFLPSLSQAIREKHDDVSAFRHGQAQLAMKAGAICILAALVAPELIHILWQGKWDNSTAIFIGVMLSTPIYTSALMAGVYLEAHGDWKARAWTVCQEAVITVGAASGALLYPKMWVLVLSVVLGRVMITLLQLAYIGRCLKKPVFSSILGNLSWQLKLGAAGALVWVLSLSVENMYASLVIKGGGFCLIFGCIYLYTRCKETMDSYAT